MPNADTGEQKIKFFFKIKKNTFIWVQKKV